MDTIYLVSVLLVPVITAVTLHEVAHGWMAYTQGDRTAWDAGRLTLNPIEHMDIVGSLLVPMLTGVLLGIPFGWAKPVPVDYGRLDARQGALVAAAGPLANLGMACVWAVLGMCADAAQNNGLEAMCSAGVVLNVAMFVLNMLPIKPLDGWRMLLCWSTRARA
jgi:Zn-dependent protease